MLFKIFFKNFFENSLKNFWKTFKRNFLPPTNFLSEVSKFGLQLHYNVNFQTNTLRKGMNPLIPRSGLNSIIVVLVQE